VYRKTFRLDSDSRTEEIISDLKQSCQESGLSTEQIAKIVFAVSEPVKSMLRRGTDVATAGGQLTMNRELRGDDYSINLVGRFGIPTGVLSRLARRLFGASR
jgi:transcriptional regulator NrdR family protein